MSRFLLNRQEHEFHGQNNTTGDREGVGEPGAQSQPAMSSG